MSTATSPDSLEVLVDREAETVTLIGDREPESTVPPTEWLTVPAEMVVDVEDRR